MVKVIGLYKDSEKSATLNKVLLKHIGQMRMVIK